MVTWNLALLGFLHPVTPKPRSQETTLASSTLIYLQRLRFVLLCFHVCRPNARKPLSGFSRVHMTCWRFGKPCSYHVPGYTDLAAGDVWEGNKSAHLTTLHPPPHLHKGKPKLTELIYSEDGIFNSYRNVRKPFLYRGVSQPLRDRGPVNSFFIDEGPVPTNLLVNIVPIFF